jgi:hypothetical protein
VVDYCTRTIILKVTRFASIIIVGFHPTIVEVEDIVVGIIHVNFFMSLAEDQFRCRWAIMVHIIEFRN